MCPSLENSTTGIAIILRQSVIKPRIKPWVDTFPSHDITEDTFADYEANDPFVQTFIMNLDSLLGKILFISFQYFTSHGIGAWINSVSMEKRKCVKRDYVSMNIFVEILI